MVKKLFALASVTALTGVFAAGASAGCSSSDEATPGGDSGTDSRPAPRRDSGKEEEDPEPVCPKNVTFEIGTVEKDIGEFKKPLGVDQGVCNEDDIAQFEKNINSDGNTKWSDFVKDIESEDCKQCIFTTNADPNWGVFVVLKDDPNSAVINWGACPSALKDSPKCGSLILDLEQCAKVDCPDDCGAAGSTQQQACVQKSFTTGGCKDVNAAVQQECGTALADCGRTLLEHATKICGGEPKTDGGTDGG